MQLRRFLGLGPTSSEQRLAALEQQHGTLQGELQALRQENARLEGLLDVAGDPDASLPDYQATQFFRQVMGDRSSRGRDLSDSKRMDALRISHSAFALRGDAFDLLNTMVDFIWGDDGIAPRAKEEDKKLQQGLDAIWTDQRNRLDARAQSMILTLFLEGELHLTATLNEHDGSVLLGWLPPEDVQQIVQDQTGRDLALVVKRGGATEPQRYFVLNGLTDQQQVSVLSSPMPAGERYQVTEGGAVQAFHGLAFSICINRPFGATRGRPQLLCSLDYIDAHDAHIWATLERERLLRHFLIDVQAEGVSTKAEADAKLRELGLSKPPEGPMVTCHSKNVEIQVVQPTFSDGSFETLERTVGMAIYAAQGMPENWRGSGSETNLATARAQEAKPLKRLRRQQGEIVGFFRDLVAVQLELQARAHAGERVKPEQWSMQVTEIGGRDKSLMSVVATQIAGAVGTLVSQNVIRRELGNRVFVQVLRESGFQFESADATLPEETEGGLDDLVAALKRDRGSEDTEGGRRMDQDDEQRMARAAAGANR